MYTIWKQFVSQLSIDDSSHDKISGSIVLKYLSGKYDKKVSTGNAALVLMIAGWISPGQNKEKFNALDFSFAKGELQFDPKAIVAITKISESVFAHYSFCRKAFSQGYLVFLVIEAKDYRRIRKG